MANLAGTDHGDAVRRGARDDAPGGPCDRLCVSETVLKRDEDRAVGERTQRDHRVRGIIRFGRDEDEVRPCVLRYAGRGAWFRNNRRLSTNSKAVGFDRRNVLRPPDESHIVPLRKKAPEEASHRAGTEHQNFHGARDAGALQNGFDVRFASSRFYINRRMDDFLSLRYF